MSPNLIKIQRIFWIGLLGFSLFTAFWVGAHITTPTLPTLGDPPVLYSNQTQDDLKILYNSAIKNSQESITVIIYSLRDRQLIHALRRQSEKGIQVNVICDPNASRGVRKKLGPKIHTHYQYSKGIMHEKILIIDNQLILMGSANLTGESLRVHTNLVLGFHSPEFSSWIQEHAMEEHQHANFQIGHQKVEFWLSKGNPEAVERIQQLMQSAEKSIRVAMFTWTRLDLAQNLAKANSRGIETAIVLDRNSKKGASRKVTEFFEQRKMPVHQYEGPGLMHHKMMLVDDHVLVNGSTNWTKAAFTKNHDCFVVLHDLSDVQKRKLKQLWGDF